jgi:serine/threonine protein kinase
MACHSSRVMAELPAIGSVVADKYRIESLLGEGGMGTVFRARHELMDKAVALKWLHPNLSKSPEAKERFMREARAAARIRHPHVVDVYDVGAHEGSLFMVMELLEGKSFEQLLARGTILVTSAVGLLIESMRGVAYAHRRGIVHRDIKPENIVVVRDAQHPAGTAKVLDFGISKLNDGRTQQNLTQSGSTMGTPRYMSLEQMNGARDVDGRADIYAFGVLLYRALTGELPFDGDTFAAIAVQVATHTPPEPIALRSELPAALSAVVMKAMARNREARYQSMDELIDALLPFAPAQEGYAAARPAGDMGATLGVAPSSAESWSELALAKSASAPSESFQAVTPPRRGRARWGALVAGSVALALGLALAWRAVAPSGSRSESGSVPDAPPKPPTPDLPDPAPAAAQLPSSVEDWSAPTPTSPSLALSPEGGAESAGDGKAASERARTARSSVRLGAPDAAARQHGSRAPQSTPAASITPPDKAQGQPPENAVVKPATAQGQRSGTLSRDEFR